MQEGVIKFEVQYAVLAKLLGLPSDVRITGVRCDMEQYERDMVMVYVAGPSLPAVLPGSLVAKVTPIYMRCEQGHVFLMTLAGNNVRTICPVCRPVNGVASDLQ